MNSASTRTSSAGELAAVLRERRTARTYAPRPLRLTELSTVLHHAAGSQQSSDPPLRPFAAAGARSELELYIVASDVEGLDRDAWHYGSLGHEVARLSASEAHLAELARWVNAATGDGLSRDPPAILLITARYERVASKYGHLALSLVYKDVGCLFENLYLVATALGLAPCAIGGANERANSCWLGLDPLAEPQVGCFLIGPR